MRNMSFMLTTAQFHNRTKTVTRRLGWWNLKPGDVVMGVEKGQGLKKGERVVRLGAIRIVSVRKENLKEMVWKPKYGLSEVVLEGFPKLTPHEFVIMFATANKCETNTEVNRIEFEYLTNSTQPRDYVCPDCKKPVEFNHGIDVLNKDVLWCHCPNACPQDATGVGDTEESAYLDFENAVNGNKK